MTAEYHAKKFLERLRKESLHKEDPVSEWRLLDRTSYFTTHCICEKDIKQVFYIQNKHTNKILEIGSDCADRWLNCSLNCMKCGNALGNVMKRRKEQNFFCITCKRQVTALDNKRFTRFKKYYNQPWKVVRDDEGYVNWLANLEKKDYYIVWFLDHCRLFYDFTEVEEEETKISEESSSIE